MIRVCLLLLDIISLLECSSEQSSMLRNRIDRHMRQRVRRATDWVSFLIDINAAICVGAGNLRNSSAALVGPEQWMWWTAPPDNIRNRLHDVISIIVSSPASSANLFAIFPALILLHPFRDGNCRSALIFLDIYNRIHQVANAHRLASAYVRLRSNRLGVAQVLSSMRMHDDAMPYVQLLERALASTELESRGATTKGTSI